MTVPPPVDSNVPHLRLSRSLRQLHPESVAQLAPAPSFDVYQQLPGDEHEHEHERAESWALLGTYKLGAQCGWLSHSRIDDDGANIFLVDNETTSTALERIGTTTPNEQQHEQPPHEQHHEQPQHEQHHEQSQHEQHHEQPQHEQHHEQPQHEQHHEQPQHEQHHEQPQHEQHHEHEQSQHEQSQHEQPQHEQPQHEQSQHEQPQHEQPQHEQPQHEQPQQVQSHLQTPEEEKSNPLLAAAAVPPAQVDTVAVQLPPTPPLASLEEDIAASYTRVPLTEQVVRALSSPPDDDTSSAPISLETMAVEIPQRKGSRELYEPATPTAGSYADLCVSMSESQYSNISSANDDGKSDDGDESDRWSEISTGPVDRQWTVVFEEKDEMV